MTKFARETISIETGKVSREYSECRASFFELISIHGEKRRRTLRRLNFTQTKPSPIQRTLTLHQMQELLALNAITWLNTLAVGLFAITTQRAVKRAYLHYIFPLLHHVFVT